MRRARTDETGSALISVLIVMMLLMAITGAMHTGVISETSLRGSHARATAGFYAAEAGVNRGMGDYRNIFLQYDFPHGSDFNSQSLSIGPRTVRYQLQPVCAALQADGTCAGVSKVIGAGRPFAGLSSTQYTYAAEATSEIHTGDIETSLGTEFEVNVVPLFQFLAFYQRDLEIMNGQTMRLHGPIRTNGKLYFSPGQPLTITDCRPDKPVPNFCPTAVPTVHIEAGDRIWRGRKNNSTCDASTATISKLADSNNDNVLDTLTLDCPREAKTNAQLSNWLGSMKQNQPQVAIPSPSSMDRGNTADDSAWTHADLRIQLDVRAGVKDAARFTFPIVVVDVNGNVDATLNPIFQNFMNARPGAIFYSDIPKNVIPSGTNPNTNRCNDVGSYCNANQYNGAIGTPVYPCPYNDALNVFPAAACNVNKYIALSNYDGALGAGLKTARRGGFYNNREQKWVYMLNVNPRVLLAWNRAQAAGSRLFDPADVSDYGPLLFLSVRDDDAAPAIPANYRVGVRVYGSPNLAYPDPQPADPTGLTVVSDQALYVEGHYNAGTAGFSKVPAALMGDTMNVLSSNWSGGVCPSNWDPTLTCDNTGVHRCCNDQQSFQVLPRRNAATTVVNAAFLAGVDDTIADAAQSGYNGGLENFPRFQETWSGGLTLTYRGSYVSLGTPRHNNGKWLGTGSPPGIYDPPVRDWDYDTTFQDVRYLPPWTPRAIFVEQILFTENFR